MKYKLTKEKIEHGHGPGGRTLYRIRATKNFGNIRKGDLGGFIEKKSNLSQRGNCWVYGDALVSGNAQVFGTARVFGTVHGNACVSEGNITGDISNDTPNTLSTPKITKPKKTKKTKQPKQPKPLPIPKTISAIRWLEVNDEAL